MSYIYIPVFMSYRASLYEYNKVIITKFLLTHTFKLRKACSIRRPPPSSWKKMRLLWLLIYMRLVSAHENYHLWGYLFLLFFFLIISVHNFSNIYIFVYEIYVHRLCYFIWHKIIINASSFNKNKNDLIKNNSRDIYVFDAMIL